MKNNEKFDNYPKDLFSDSFKENIARNKALFEQREEYINKPKVKLAVLGNTSSGKSTLINALLEEEILYEGIPEGTSCAAKCQSSSNNEEYFEIYKGNACSPQSLPISEIKHINHNNRQYLKIAMDINNYLDIYLNASNHSILDKLLIIDCPGYNDNNFDAIKKYCEHADILIFCFVAKAGVTDEDINKIKAIKNKIGKFLKGFIINYCDECDNIDRNGIINKLSPHLTGEDAIYFISALEAKKKTFNDVDKRILEAQEEFEQFKKCLKTGEDSTNNKSTLEKEKAYNDVKKKALKVKERHEEFDKFKKCIKNQKSLASFTYRKVFMDLISSVMELLDCLNFTNFRECQFTDIAFDYLHQQIITLINNNGKKYEKKESNQAMLEYSNQANKEISNILLKQFVRDHDLKEGIIFNNYFYKRFILNDDIGQPSFWWFEWGDKSKETKEFFLNYFASKLTRIKSEIQEHFNKQASRCLDELRTYKNELNEIKTKIDSMSYL